MVLLPYSPRTPSFTLPHPHMAEAHVCVVGTGAMAAAADGTGGAHHEETATASGGVSDFSAHDAATSPGGRRRFRIRPVTKVTGAGTPLPPPPYTRATAARERARARTRVSHTHGRAFTLLARTLAHRK